MRRAWQCDAKGQAAQVRGHYIGSYYCKCRRPRRA